MKFGPSYGARVLDRYMPDWFTPERINLLQLDMVCPRLCVAGQLFASRMKGKTGYGWFLESRPPTVCATSRAANRMGFATPHGIQELRTLEREWTELILERRASKNFK